MTFIFKNVVIVEPASTAPSPPVDILIENGIISNIGKELKHPVARVFEWEDLHVSIGWMDIGAAHGDPGAEHREDLISLREVGASGGFTALAPWPDTNPCADNKAAIHYLLQGNPNHPVAIFPIASLSEKGNGKEMAELMDLHKAGAIAFSDGTTSIKNAGLLYRSLKYLQAFSGICIHFPMDNNLVVDGQIHEGKWSTLLGLPGIPDVAEDLMVQRDLSILNYSGGTLILWGISSALALNTLLQNEKLNQSVFISVPLLNLLFTDENIAAFDTHYKVMPPLRANSDKETLRRAVLNGDIKIISSNHTPWETDHKNLEFPYASFGSITLQQMFPLLRTYFQELPLSKLVEILAYQPRQILKIPIPAIREGAKANLTFFSPNKQSIIAKEDNKSKSENSPFWGEKMVGRVYGVYNEGILKFFDDHQ
jgi:dihydroorotase